MGSNSKTTLFLKECMSDSLLKLMREKDFYSITVNDIAQAAGVNRSTWFRNFSTKNEALTFKIVQLWNRRMEERGLGVFCPFTQENAAEFFDFHYTNRHIMRQIYAAKLQATIHEAFYQIIAQESAAPEPLYHGRFCSYGLLGLLDEWIKSDYRESPEEMARLFSSIIPSMA